MILALAQRGTMRKEPTRRTEFQHEEAYPYRTAERYDYCHISIAARNKLHVKLLFNHE